MNMLRTLIRYFWFWHPITSTTPAAPAAPVCPCGGTRLVKGQVGQRHTPWGEFRDTYQNFCYTCERPIGKTWDVAWTPRGW